MLELRIQLRGLVFNETGLVPQHQVWQLLSDTPLGAPIDIYYSYVGSLHNETWYILITILEATDRYVYVRGDQHWLHLVGTSRGRRANAGRDDHHRCRILGRRPGATAAAAAEQQQALTQSGFSF